MNINKEIKENWFKDHKAKITRHTENLLILDWAKPGTNTYRVRYVLDGGYLFVSGDLGEAAFCLTWNAGKKGLESFKDLNIGYLFGKLSAWNGEKYDFDSDIAFNHIKEEIDEIKREYLCIEDYEGSCEQQNKKIKNHINILEKIMSATKDFSRCKEWSGYLAYNGIYDELSKYDPDCYEWIFGIGDVIPIRIKAYLIGIKMAYEQLKDDAE